MLLKIHLYRYNEKIYHMVNSAHIASSIFRFKNNL